MMDVQQLNATAGVALVTISLLALAAVLAEFRRPVRVAVKGKVPSPPLFEVSVLALCVIVVVFIATADYSTPRTARPLGYCALAIAAAMGAQYWQRELR